MAISAAEYLRRIKSLQSKPLLRQMIYDIMKQDEWVLKALKKEEMMRGDIFSNGIKAKYKSKSYANYKYGKNSNAGYMNVDLVLTGAFANAMFIKKTQKLNAFTFGNRNGKRRKLTTIYGDDLFGLNQETFNRYQKETLAPKLSREIQRRLDIE